VTKNEENQEKKIIVDEDWKDQAQKEKEILAKQEEVEKEKTEEKTKRPPLPKGDFAALVSMLVTQALFALGVLKVEGHDKEPDLEMAKYNIDMLEALEEKAKGNLTDEEKTVLENTLSDIRMAYVKASGDK